MSLALRIARRQDTYTLGLSTRKNVIAGTLSRLVLFQPLQQIVQWHVRAIPRRPAVDQTD